MQKKNYGYQTIAPSDTVPPLTDINHELLSIKTFLFNGERRHMTPYVSILLNSSPGIHLHVLQTLSGALSLILMPFVKRYTAGQIRGKRKTESKAGVSLVVISSSSPLALLVALNYHPNVHIHS